MFEVPRTAGGHPRIVIGALIAGVLGLAAFAGARSAAPAEPAGRTVRALPARPPVEEVSALPQLAARLQASRFMGGVLVARGDEVLFRHVQGVADVDLNTPLALDSRFRLASISKQFTAVALLKLQDEGRLTIADPVCQHIQPCPQAWAALRLHHLISHTSGIPDLMQRPGWGGRRTTPATLDELTRDSAAYRLSFEPGTDVRYNNAGFNLAAAVVEAVSGQPFDLYLKTALFDPLGMADTGLGDAPGVATGHADFPAGLTAQRQPNVSIVVGAGALYSTLDDMLAWSRALHGGHVLSTRSYAQLVADHSPPDAQVRRRRYPREWGYGVFVSPLGRQVDPAFDEPQIYHTGSWSGFRNLATYQPDADITVIVLSNNYHQTAEVLLISQQAMAEALGRSFPTGLQPRD